MNFLKKYLLILAAFSAICLTSNAFASHYQYEVTVCAVFKDEAPYMREWVEFHMAQGVQHFYLYDNLSFDLRHLALDDYIHCGIVEIIPWPYTACDCKGFEEICCKAYMHCIERIRHKARWCAFLDCREFLFSPSGTRLNVFLRKYHNYPCLSIHRQVFGTSYIGPNSCGPGCGMRTSCGEVTFCGLLTRNLFWKCHTSHECCKPLKTIVQPKFVTGCKCPGKFTFKHGTVCVNANKKPIHEGKSIVIDKIRINFYPFRDLNFFYSLGQRNYCCCPFIREWGLNIDLNCIYDDCILNACPRFAF